MAIMICWFIGTLVIPIYVPLDDLFGFPNGAFTVISWIAAGVSSISSDNHALKRMAFNQETEPDSPASAIGNTLVWTLILMIGITIIKVLFTE